MKADDLGHLSLVDLGGRKRDLTGHYPGGIQGIAWTPAGDEVWHTAVESGTNFELRAVRRGGGPSRVVVRVPGRLILQDISRDDRVLVTRDTIRLSLMVLPRGNIAAYAGLSAAWLGDSRRFSPAFRLANHFA